MSDRYEKVLQPFRTQASMMEERIASGIEQHRKAYATLRFVDRDGTPLTDVHVQAEQVTHDFQFGCSIFLLDELETAEKNRQYEEAFRNTFNLAVAPFYWGDLEPTQGKPRYAVDSP
ncbi:MAG: glycoside hydrolase family 10, partial [Clostridia bacterium]